MFYFESELSKSLSAFQLPPKYRRRSIFWRHFWFPGDESAYFGGWLTEFSLVSHKVGILLILNLICCQGWSSLQRNPSVDFHSSPVLWNILSVGSSLPSRFTSHWMIGDQRSTAILLSCSCLNTSAATTRWFHQLSDYSSSVNSSPLCCHHPIIPLPSPPIFLSIPPPLSSSLSPPASPTNLPSDFSCLWFCF